MSSVPRFASSDWSCTEVRTAGSIEWRAWLCDQCTIADRTEQRLVSSARVSSRGVRGERPFPHDVTSFGAVQRSFSIDNKPSI
jgi:hypothetical protein